MKAAKPRSQCTLAVRTVGRLILVREARLPPHDHEWNEFLNMITMAREQASNVRILVATDGGGPDPNQRRRLEAALGGIMFKVAVVSDSMKMRFVVSSIALLNSDISTFATSQLEAAYEYLELTPSERKTAQMLLPEMAALLSR